jgi:hypothetical protein
MGQGEGLEGTRTVDGGQGNSDQVSTLGSSDLSDGGVSVIKEDVWFPMVNCIKVLVGCSGGQKENALDKLEQDG